MSRYLSNFSDYVRQLKAACLDFSNSLLVVMDKLPADDKNLMFSVISDKVRSRFDPLSEFHRDFGDVHDANQFNKMIDRFDVDTKS